MNIEGWEQDSLPKEAFARAKKVIEALGGSKNHKQFNQKKFNKRRRKKGLPALHF